MGAIAKHLLFRAGTIRRVVRVDGRCVCGICRRSYEDAREAQDCVDQCWEDVLSLDPVIARSRVFRCRFCARDHRERKLAYRCAEACRTKALTLRGHEIGLEEEDDGPRERKFKPRLLSMPAPVRLMPRAAAISPKPKASDAEKPGLSPISVDIGTSSDESGSMDGDVAIPEPDAAVDDAGGEAVAKKKRKATGHMFYRDGARYVCQECHAKHFTRDDVEKCFASHVAS